MAIWVSKEPYRSDKLIYGVVNPQNGKKLSEKCKKRKCQFFLCIFWEFLCIMSRLLCPALTGPNLLLSIIFCSYGDPSMKKTRLQKKLKKNIIRDTPQCSQPELLSFPCPLYHYLYHCSSLHSLPCPITVSHLTLLPDHQKNQTYPSENCRLAPKDIKHLCFNAKTLTQP